jgi:hypothetical protein
MGCVSVRAVDELKGRQVARGRETSLGASNIESNDAAVAMADREFSDLITVRIAVQRSPTAIGSPAGVRADPVASRNPSSTASTTSSSVSSPSR